MSFTDIPMDTLEDGPDLDVIARQLVAGKKKLKRGAVPADLDLAARITGLSITDTMEGSSTLHITILDDDWELLDSGFFDNDADGKIDPIDLNYPDGSRFWWRVTQVSPSSGQTVELTCMERAAVYLMGHRGPVKTSRAKKTRAEFLKGLTGKVKAGGGITFLCSELTKKQKTEPDAAPTTQTADDKDENKSPGIHANENLKIGGSKASKAQLAQVERALGVASDEKASQRATVAMVCAGIGESGFQAIMNRGGSPYGGVFQGNVRDGTWDKEDTEGMAKSFLRGGKGFQGGGAITLADAHSDWGPGLIAVTVEGSRSNFGSDNAAEHHYGQWKSEAEKLIEAYGGGSFGGGTTYRKQYNFQVGSQDEPHETYWDAMTRLADEVNWALFLDGNRLYYDAEPTLIKQKPAALIRRDDPAVVSWSGDWDARHIATQMELTLVCDPFAFRAGQVLKLEGFGPFSTGSTAKLPGRWLIQDIERDHASFASTFTLKQPEKPNREPTSELGTRDDADTGGGTGDVYEAAKQISDEGHAYPRPDVHHGAFSGFTKDTDLDCSESTAYALHLAGYFDGSQAIVSGEFASSWGKPGRGTEWTVWANGGHVFIQSEGSGPKWRFDTGGHPGISGPRVVAEHRSTAGFTAKHADTKDAGK